MQLVKYLDDLTSVYNSVLYNSNLFLLNNYEQPPVKGCFARNPRQSQHKEHFYTNLKSNKCELARTLTRSPAHMHAHVLQYRLCYDIAYNELCNHIQI